MKRVFYLFSIILFLGSFVDRSSDSYTIKGKVTDDNGIPLIAASITEVGTNNATITDYDGMFTLRLSSKGVEFDISYTGYMSKTLKANKTDYTIILETGAVLDEIILTNYSIGQKAKRFFNKVSSPIATHHHTKDYEGSPENYTHFEDNSFKSTTQDPLATMSIDVDRASYSNVRRFIDQGSLPPKDAVRTEEMINYFNYDYSGPEQFSSSPFKVYQALTDCPWNQDHQLLHVAMKAKTLDRSDIPASNFVFLIDVSGSMSSANKLPLLKESYKLLVNQLGAEDRISIVVYAGSAGAVLEGAKGDDKEAILNALDQLQAGGSTAGAAGILKAYELGKKHFIKGGNNRILLATDGDFNVGVSSDGELVRLIEKERESGIYLSILGFGMGNYQDSKMQELAGKGNGNHFYIDNIDEAKKSLIEEFGSTLYTVAKDVKIQIEFNPRVVSGYRVIGYENRQLDNEDFNDDKVDAGELGAGHCVTVIYEIIPNGVESEYVRPVDALKYQKEAKRKRHEDLATIKFRYKPLGSNRSVKEEIEISKTVFELASVNPNFRWSTAMAGFGMVLRDSPYKGDLQYDLLITEATKIADQIGNVHMIQCVKMMKSAQEIMINLPTEQF